VYTLNNFPSLKTLIAHTRASRPPGSVISILTGDFLAPYLLSSVDKGAGMMNALAKTPIDYVTWGNHEADIDHRTVCKHVRAFPGKWLNTNMQDHAAMDAQLPFDIIELTSADGSHTRRVGLVAVLSDDPGLYSHFKPPGAFGGATIADPWTTLADYKALLEGPEHRCDVVLPLQHTYVPDDHRTCRQFDFPLVLSGHDHHRVDEVIEGTRLLKPGLDAIAATVLELSWAESGSPRRPDVRAQFVETSDWPADAALAAECERSYRSLLPLRNTELARVPPAFEPLSSRDARARVCTMGMFLCTLLRSSLNSSRRQRSHRVDAVLLMGGNVRGGSEYPPGSFFSLEALEAEVKPDETLGIVPMPGWLLDAGVSATHDGDPIPGWFQYDEGVREVRDADGRWRVTHVGGEPLEAQRVYRVATKVSDLTNGQSAPLTDYFGSQPHLLPPKGAYVNVHAELMR
jgi:2',3'-cyclic-nucleotide 2'-phosphodiesterase (5'-nucleotidase family)